MQEPRCRIHWTRRNISLFMVMKAASLRPPGPLPGMSLSSEEMAGKPDVHRNPIVFAKPRAHRIELATGINPYAYVTWFVETEFLRALGESDEVDLMRFDPHIGFIQGLELLADYEEMLPELLKKVAAVFPLDPSRLVADEQLVLGL